ncbi:MAG: glycosyl hydrolase family 28-related protein [Sporomusaceae bacterium]|nr:glycosyl hydrolase family 28-related protein [Sporomusaceae bacterium]
MSISAKSVAKWLIILAIGATFMAGCTTLAAKLSPEEGQLRAGLDQDVVKAPLPLVPSGALNAKNFGALGDGVHDDTAALQHAVDEAANDGKSLWIPPGNYLVDALTSLKLRDHSRLYLTERTTLQAKPNRAAFYVVLSIENVQDVMVFGGTICGDRQRHQGTEGQWGTGLFISGSRQVLVQGITAKDCWGDGIYIGTEVFTGPGTWKQLNAVPEDIMLMDVMASGNRRQGISLIAGRNVTLLRPVLTSTQGQDPEGGLDLEPNRPSDSLEHVVITDPITARNAGAGIQLLLGNLAGAAVPVSVEIKNHHDFGSKRGLSIVGSDEIIAGRVQVAGALWENNRLNGLKIENHDSRSYYIDLANIHVINANRSGLRGANADGAAIAIVHKTGNVPGRTACIGRITLTNPLIEEQGSLRVTTAPFYIWDCQAGYQIRELVIDHPVLGGLLQGMPYYENVLPFIQDPS